MTSYAKAFLIVAMALLPLWTASAIAFDSHDISTRLNCAICKSAADLGAADQTSGGDLIPQESVTYAAHAETALTLPWKIALPDLTRPPPNERA